MNIAKPTSRADQVVKKLDELKHLTDYDGLDRAYSENNDISSMYNTL